MSGAVEGTVAWLHKLPPEERLKIIDELRRIYPARFLRAVGARARGEIERAIREACSMARINDYRYRARAYREAGMVLSEFGSRVGNRPGVRETQRWTPPQAVMLEDRYDAMDAIEAAACGDPPSVTGLQFQRLEMRRGRLESLAKRRAGRP